MIFKFKNFSITRKFIIFVCCLLIMPVQNALEMKERILSILRRRGPSLPVHIAKETGLSILFAAAFLSELVADKKVKYSDMKVGSSPLYYINEHWPMLEKFGGHLKSKEKDAFNLLKERKFIRDREQSPQIRVALRTIKDFAVSFNRNGELIWRYYIIPESELAPDVIKPLVKEKEEIIVPKIQAIEIEKKEKPIEVKLEKPIEIKIEKPKETKKEHQKELNVLERPKKEKPRVKKSTKKKKSKIDDNFFNKVKEWALGHSMEILDIHDFNKNELHLKVKKDGKEHLLVAYNKKRLTDADLVRANKKAKELGIGYAILSFGELQKKMSDIIDAAKNLSEIKKIE